MRAVWPWLPLWLLLALLAIFAHGPMPLFSTRTLAVAWEMWNHQQWLVPHLNGMPYSHKVPLLYWMFHAGWAVFGVNDIWPRVLQVTLGAAQLLLAWTLARRLLVDKPRVARASVWILLSLGYPFLYGLQLMYDVLLAVWVLAALVSLLPRPGRNAPRWFWFGLFVGLGLLSKGPVMLLHVVFPWLLGPLWSDRARCHRLHWYGGGLLAMLGGLILFALWLVPAMQAGGAEYAQELLFKQTEGRVVDAFVHAQPFWWYVPIALVLLFPYSLWPGLWLAVGRLRRPLEPALHFALCWVLPTWFVFSMVSSKQMYYLIPELGGASLLLAVALGRFEAERPGLLDKRWMRPWPAALLALLAGLGLLVLPALVQHGVVVNHWLVDLARYSRACGLVYLALAVLVMLRGSGSLRRFAMAGLVGVFATHALFTLTSWHNFDLRPATQRVAQAARSGQPIARLGTLYAGALHFSARLDKPVVQLQPVLLADWAARHPDGLVVVDQPRLGKAALQHALLVQPFRSQWLVLWRAETLAALRAGKPLPPARQPAELVPEGYWRYDKVR